MSEKIGKAKKIENLEKMISSAEEKIIKLKCQIKLYEDQKFKLQCELKEKIQKDLTNRTHEEKELQSKRDKENYRSKIDALRAKYEEQFRQGL